MHVFDRGLGKQEKEEKEVCFIRDFADYRYNNLHYVNRFFPFCTIVIFVFAVRIYFSSSCLKFWGVISPVDSYYQSEQILIICFTLFWWSAILCFSVLASCTGDVTCIYDESWRSGTKSQLVAHPQYPQYQAKSVHIMGLFLWSGRKLHLYIQYALNPVAIISLSRVLLALVWSSQCSLLCVVVVWLSLPVCRVFSFKVEAKWQKVLGESINKFHFHWVTTLVPPCWRITRY